MNWVANASCKGLSVKPMMTHYQFDAKSNVHYNWNKRPTSIWTTCIWRKIAFHLNNMHLKKDRLQNGATFCSGFNVFCVPGFPAPFARCQTYGRQYNGVHSRNYAHGTRLFIVSGWYLSIFSNANTMLLKLLMKVALVYCKYIYVMSHSSCCT